MGSHDDDGGHVKLGFEDPEAKKARLEEMFLVPGEVMSRRTKKKVTKEEAEKVKEEYITMDWEDVFRKKPYERLRWIFKAFQGAKEGRIKAAPLYGIISHRRFIDGLVGNVATDVLNLIRANLDMFSPKQKKQLTSDNFELFRKYAPISIIDSDEDEADAPPLPPPPEVVIEERKKKKGGNDEERRRREERDREEEEAGHDSGDDLEVKKRRLLSKGVERRVDPADGAAYTLDDFVAEYGGRPDAPPTEWVNAAHTAFIFKA